MSNITRLTQFVNGVLRGVDLTTNNVVVGSLQLNGATSGNLTQQANATTTSYTIIWPAAQASGTQMLQNDGAGNLSWATSTSGANTALSNLSAVAINTDLLPGADDSINLGSASKSWAAASIHTLLDGSSATSVDAYNRALLDSAAATQLSWSTSGVEFNQLTASTVPYLSSGKVLTSSAVTPTQLGYLSGTTGTTGTGNLVLSASPTFTGTLAAAAASLSGILNMNSNKITNVANGTAASDAANYGQILALVAGLSFKNAVVVATTTTLPAYTWASGAGGADTLTANSTGTLTIDGVLTALGNRILVKNETGGNAPYNGIYTVTTAGAVGVAYVLTRATDMQSWSQVPGSVTVAQSGTVNADSGFVCTSATGGALDTNNITWSEFGYFLADGTTLTLTGNVFSITNAGVGTTQLANSSVTAAKLGAVTDGVTLDQSGAGSTLEIKTAGVGTTQLASASVTAAKLGTVTDGVTLDQSGAGSTLEIKTAGVGTTQLASASVTAAKLGTITDGVTLDQSGAGSTLEIKTAGVGTTQLASASVTAAKLGTVTDGITTDQNGAGSTIEVLQSPKLSTTQTAGVSFAANTSFLVRWALNGETAGRVYKADQDATTTNNYYAFGIASSTSSVSAGQTISVTSQGLYALGSSDTPFSSGDVGKPVYLTASGAFSTTAPTTTNYAIVRIGMVATTTSIWVSPNPDIGIN